MRIFGGGQAGLRAIAWTKPHAAAKGRRHTLFARARAAQAMAPSLEPG